MKSVRNSVLFLAAASFALAQPAAAATRSYQALPSSGVSVDRLGAAVGSVESLRRDCDRVDPDERRACEAAGHPFNVVIILAVFGGLLALFAAAGLFGHGKDSTG